MVVRDGVNIAGFSDPIHSGSENVPRFLDGKTEKCPANDPKNCCHDKHGLVADGSCQPAADQRGNCGHDPWDGIGQADVSGSVLGIREFVHDRNA